MTVEHKISLLGPIPYDRITTWKHEVFDRYGCLIYPVLALSTLLGKSARITPVAHVRKKDQQTIKTILKGYPGVELLRITADKDQGDVIQLRFISKYKSLEKQYGFMDPIMPEDVKHLLDSNYFLVLPVTDFEISLETLRFIKEYSEGLVIFDAHGATTAMTSLGDRVIKFWVDRDLWLPYIDVLSITIEQAKYIWFVKEYSLEQLEEAEDLTEDTLQAFADHCFNYQLKALYINYGDAGCLVFTKKDDKLIKERIPAVQLNETVDNTGINESFAAGLTYGLIKTNGDYVKAARFGNVVGAQRVRSIDYDVFDSAERTAKIVQETYGD
jgi:adenosine kinase